MLNRQEASPAPAAAPQQPKRRRANWHNGEPFFDYLVSYHHRRQDFFEEWLQELFDYVSREPATGYGSTATLRYHAMRIYAFSAALDPWRIKFEQVPRALRTYLSRRFQGSLDLFTRWLDQLHMFILLEPEQGNPKWEAPALRQHLTHLHHLQLTMARFEVIIPDYV